MTTTNKANQSSESPAVWRWIGALFTDTKNGKQAVSLGRVVFLMLIAAAISFWTAGRELPPGMLELIYTMAGYNAVSKGIMKIGGR